MRPHTQGHIDWATAITHYTHDTVSHSQDTGWYIAASIRFSHTQFAFALGWFIATHNNKADMASYCHSWLPHTVFVAIITATHYISISSYVAAADTHISHSWHRWAMLATCLVGCNLYSLLIATNTVIRQAALPIDIVGFHFHWAADYAAAIYCRHKATMPFTYLPLPMPTASPLIYAFLKRCRRWLYCRHSFVAITAAEISLVHCYYAATYLRLATDLGQYWFRPSGWLLFITLRFFSFFLSCHFFFFFFTFIIDYQRHVDYQVSLAVDMHFH